MTRSFYSDPTKPDVRLLRLRSAGMFSNVNEVVEQLRRAEIGGYRFVIDWSASCYRATEREGDPWCYYFEPCFAESEGDWGSLPALRGGRLVACCRDNIITPHREDGNCDHLLLPLDRNVAHALISRYLRLKTHVGTGIDHFATTHFRPHMIGLHIRGSGRWHGVRPSRRRNELHAVPVENFFCKIDEALRLLPEAGIFAASDSSDVIHAIQARYGDRVVTYPALRSAHGEMHRHHPANNGQVFPPYRLGLDVLSEAWLLARTNFLVHGTSNVTNFVLCASPHMLHAYTAA